MAVFLFGIQHLVYLNASTVNAGGSIAQRWAFKEFQSGQFISADCRNILDKHRKPKGCVSSLDRPYIKLKRTSYNAQCPERNVNPMALYLLSYDITEKNHDYQSLWDFLNGLGAVRLLYSEWAVPWKNDSSALELINTTLQHVLPGDGVLACELFNNKTVAWRTVRISTQQFQALLTKYARSW